jgi:NAD kinase
MITLKNMVYNMNIKNVLITTKQTALEYYRQNYDVPEEVIPADLLVSKKREHSEHYNSIKIIKDALEKHNISYHVVYMPYAAHEEFIGRDLVIAVGGDGTVLNTARYIRDNTPLLTVKSEGDSVGALCTIKAKDFVETFEKILSGNFRIELWNRAEGKFGNKTDIALNEIAIGTKHFNGMATYEVKFGDKKEIQRSSKIIVSTGAGSTGWYNNIHNSNGVFHPSISELRFTVSESIKSHNYKMLHGHVMPGDVLEIVSLMDTEGTISFDGDKNKRMYNFPIGQKICIKISDKPLHMIFTK